MGETSLVDIFVDESSQTKHRFLVLGGIGTYASNSLGLIEDLAKARLPELPKGELKWTKVSKTKLPAYKRFVDVLFDLPKIVHFHSLVVDSTRLDHKRFNAGDREIGFNKEIYQLAMKFARLYRADIFHLYPDRRETTQKPEDLRLMLNRGCVKKGDKRDWPFRRCQFRDSTATPQLQLVDVVIGALAYKLNGHDKLPGASPAKTELSAYILNRAGIADVTKDTAISGPFTLWHRQLR